MLNFLDTLKHYFYCPTPQFYTMFKMHNSKSSQPHFYHENQTKDFSHKFAGKQLVSTSWVVVHYFTCTQLLQLLLG